MKRYEAMFILKGDLDKAAMDKVMGQIQEAVTKHKGGIEEFKEWGKHRLCYPIKKYKEGIYYILNFNIAPDAIDAIKKSLTLNDSILRLLVIAI